MKKLLLIISILLSTILSADGFSNFKVQNQSNFLKPSEAFKVKAKTTKDGVNIDINLANKIHIYKNKLTATITKPTTKEIKLNLPKGKIITGEEAYEGNLTLKIPNKNIAQSGNYTLEVYLQGCSDEGVCYMPQTYTFNLVSNTPAASAKRASTPSATTSTNTNESFFSKISRLAKEGNSKEIAKALQNEGLLFILLLFFIVGLLLALTPCILPMIPILSSILLQQAGKQEGGLSKGASFSISLVYVVAMAASYAVIGVVAGLLNFDLQANLNNPWVIVPVALIFVALALSLFGYFDIALPQSLQTKLTNVSNNAQGKGLVGTAIMGAISALIVGACTAPVISGAILFISMTGNATLGGLALFVMGIGAGMPLLLVGLGANNLVPKPGGWMESVSKFFGFLMLIMALYVARGVLSPTLFIYLFSFTLIGAAIMFGVFDSKEAKGFAGLFKTFNFVLLLYGAILFIGATSGSTSIINPLQNFTGNKATTKHTNKHTKTYTLQSLLQDIKNSSKPVIVDIGKDNCAACTELAEITFPNPSVQQELKRFKFIKLDITNYTKEDQKIMNHFKIFGAPNILFFNSNAKPLENKFQQGFVKPERLLQILKTIN
jgi:thiol:disulfide interchange protein DsbD